MSERAPTVQPAFATFARLVAVVAAYVVAGSLTGRLLGLGPADVEDAPIEPTMLAHGAGCLAVCCVTLLWPARGRSWAMRGVVPAPPLYGAFLLAWVPFTLFVYAGLLGALHVDLPAQPHLEYFTGADTRRWQFVGVLATIVVVGPLAEELVFRGLLRDLLRAALGVRAGLWLTALVFGLFHGLVLALPIALLGLFFGWLRERYDSLAPGFLVHALHNGITVGITMAWPHLLHEVYR